VCPCVHRRAWSLSAPRQLSFSVCYPSQHYPSQFLSVPSNTAACWLQGPQTAQSLRGLAETHKARGSLPQAKLCLEESIATFEACGALEHSDYGTALGSLAHVVDLQGNSKKADRLYTKALAILMGAAATEPEDNKDQEGEEKGPSEGANPELAQILNNHAETLLLLGRKKDAKDAFRLAMKYATWS